MSVYGILSTYKQMTANNAGNVQTEFLPGGARIYQGYLKQIMIRQSGGPATQCDIEVRYTSSSSDHELLVYKEDSVSLAGNIATINPASGHGVPFNCVGIVGKSHGQLDGNLSVSITTDSGTLSTLEVRLDLDIFKPTFGGEVRGAFNAPTRDS